MFPDPLAQSYIRLAHGIDAHQPGYIDGYGGPPELADRSHRTPAGLQTEAQQLADLIAAEPNDARRRYLHAQHTAMTTSLRLLAGERLDYAQEVKGLYDLSPHHTDEAVFQAALDTCDAVLPGSGPRLERAEALRARVNVPPADLLRVSAPILTELRRRTDTRYGLPAGEDFSIGLVKDQPWSGYNWPLGDLKSRIDINTDLPMQLTRLPDLLAHEGYPGHHTEHALKEHALVRGRGWGEFGIQLINTPECVVSEGIAVRALDAVMSPQEVGAWLTGELSTLTGLDPQAVAAHHALMQAQQGLGAVSGNAALLLHGEGASEAAVLDYLMTYSLSSEAQARQSLRFISNPTFRAYIFTYSEGGRLVREATQRGLDYGELLKAPTTPGELKERIKASQISGA